MAEQNTTDKLTLAKFEEAYDIVHKVVLPTKLIYSDYFSGITGNKVYFKPENLQKTGAYKIRGAYYKISTLSDEERQKGLITASAGNHAQGVAYAAKAYGVKATIVMPSSTPLIKVNRTKAYGAEVVLTDGTKGMKGAIEKADELAKEIPNSFIAGQFVNPANPATHKKTTGPEIWEDTDGEVDIFVAGVGTGGTITGTGEYLKEKKPEVKIVAVEPASSPVLSEGVSGPHKIQGIGAGFVPETLNTSIYDEIIKVENEDAFETGKYLAAEEAILAGISSGAALYAAIQLAKREENKGKTIVVLLPDNGDRYYSTPLFAK